MATSDVIKHLELCQPNTGLPTYPKVPYAPTADKAQKTSAQSDSALVDKIKPGS